MLKSRLYYSKNIKIKAACRTGNCVSAESDEVFKMDRGFMDQVIGFIRI